jgi:hypothetical protein
VASSAGCHQRRLIESIAQVRLAFLGDHRHRGPTFLTPPLAGLALRSKPASRSSCDRFSNRSALPIAAKVTAETYGPKPEKKNRGQVNNA